MSVIKNHDQKIVLITGASRGIGRGLAIGFAKQGAHVIALSRNTKHLENLDDEIKNEGGQATLIPCDLRDFDAVDRLGPSLFEKFGCLDIAFCNAGFLGTLAPIAHTNNGDWKNVLDTNLNANFHLIRTLDPVLRQSKKANLVLMSTGQSVTAGRAYWGAYAVSKAALETLAMTYADEVSDTKIKVNIIDPGAVRTEMRAQAKPGENPLTLPTPEDVAMKCIDIIAQDSLETGKIIRL